jgi:hypothetical protein
MAERKTGFKDLIDRWKMIAANVLPPYSEFWLRCAHFLLNNYLSRMFRYLIAFSCMLLISSCFMHKSAKKTRTKQVALEYGMTHEEALAAITDRSEVLVGEFNRKAGKMLVYCYTRYGKAGAKTTRYYLYFLNDTLYHKSSSEDLQAEVRLAMKDRRKILDEREEKEERMAAKQAAEKQRTVEAERREAERAAKAEEARQKRAEPRRQDERHSGKKRSSRKKHRKTKEAE